MRRGFTLLAALLVVAIVTVMVVGLIAMGGSERSAGALRMRAERLSGCVQAARNLFLSQVRVLQGNVEAVELDTGLPHPDGTLAVQSRHFSGSVALDAVTRLPDSSVGGAGDQAHDLSNQVGRSPLLAGYYTVTALCRDPTGGAEQEIEFTVRVGL